MKNWETLPLGTKNYIRFFCSGNYSMESQTRVSKRAPREFRSWRVQGNPPTLCQPFANPLPTLCQPFANPSPTFRQPFAHLFCQPLSNPLFLWTPGTLLETRVNSFLVIFGNYYSKLYSIKVLVRIGAVLPWKPQIFRLQLQFFSRRCVRISYCNVTPFFTGFFVFSEYNM